MCSALSPAEQSVPLDSVAQLPSKPDWECQTPTPTPKPGRLGRWVRTIFHHLRRHTGLGAVCAVAYFDPGNWSVDLQAGSEYGYKLLFVVLLAGLMAVVFQSMASRLGCVTGLDLAAHCRLLLYNRTSHPRLCRWLVLYPLYALAEVAIISTDLAELLGSATALSLLFPSLPLWAGVLITASDVFIILAFCSPRRGANRPQRVFELLISVLVLAVFLCLIFVITQVKPDWGDTFLGFVPSSTIVKPGALYVSIGIVGATVMPHGLFLGSSLATQNRVLEFSDEETASESEKAESLPAPASSASDRKFRFSSLKLNKHWLRSALQSWRIEGSEEADLPDDNAGHSGWMNNSLAFVRAHLTHGIVDIVLSLLGFAVVINSLILIIASAVFFYASSGEDTSVADLFEAYALIRARVGKAAAVLFALALLCAGESAGITATLAGQIVSEGFLKWHVSPVIRRALTRLIGLVPAMLVASIMGRSGLNALLVASQVVLSFVLPFVAFPLVWLTSSSKVMLVRRESGSCGRVDGASDPSEEARGPENVDGKAPDFSNGKIVMLLGYTIWLVVLIANVYVLVTLAMGEDG
ncbi:SMF1_2 [Sanghuangporus sanghuang]